MPLPSKKTPKSRQGHRRSHHALHRVGLTTCPNCKARIRPHRVCPSCGWYRGRHVQKLESLAERRRRRERKAEGKKPEEKEAKKEAKKEEKKEK